MIVKLSFDDATIDDLGLADLLAKYDLVENTILYWPVMPTICNEPKGRRSLSEGDRGRLAKDFEIGGHGLTHQLLTRIPLEIAKREIFESRDILQKKFGQEIRSFAYPRGYANPDIQKLVQEAGYHSARSTLVGYIHESENPYFEQTTVHVGVNRKEYGGQYWLDYATYLLEKAASTKDSVYSIFGHSWELSKFSAWKDFEELLKRIKEAL